MNKFIHQNKLDSVSAFCLKKWILKFYVMHSRKDATIEFPHF